MPDDHKMPPEMQAKLDTTLADLTPDQRAAAAVWTIQTILRNHRERGTFGALAEHFASIGDASYWLLLWAGALRIHNALVDADEPDAAD